MVSPTFIAGGTAIDQKVTFPNLLRCTPASIPFWDGAGNSGKLSVLTTGATSFTDNVTNSGSGIFNIGPDGFIGALYSGSTAFTAFIHYTADCTIPGG
jgi:hypothetical protein